MGRNLSELFERTDIERGARSISDPIARLRYVRKATAIEEPKPKPTEISRRWLALGIVIAALPLQSDGRRAKRPALASARMAAPVRQVGATPDVWPVEQNREYDLYSNGLRIENQLETANEPRSYALLCRESLDAGPRRTQPAGIVYHMTESDQAPFESKQKPALKRIGREVLLYVRNKRAYHFVIDRFGRVHRIVSESDSANHAGHSIWADARWLYVNLNDSFLGVAFEARTDEAVTAAQVSAARSLTEVLRSRYRIAAENCVTHAQVSVNPSNRRIGWHTDWADRFPFRELGLPDNYEIPNPSLWRFGFEYDPPYAAVSAPALRKSLAAADEQVRLAAAGRGLAVEQYRGLLQQEYQQAQAIVRRRAAQESEDEQN